MRFLKILVASVLLLPACASQFSQHQLGEWTGKPRVAVLVRGEAPDWFAQRLLIGLGKRVENKVELVNQQGDLEIVVTLEPLEMNYLPMYLVLPMALGFFGLPQGGISGEFWVRISDTRTKRLLAIWEGRETRVFGLYRLIPRAERDVYVAILENLEESLSEALLAGR